MILVFILCVGLLILGYLCSKDNVLSPAVLTPAVWIVCLLLFWFLRHDLPPLKLQFLVCISLWTTLFCTASLLMQNVRFRQSSYQKSPSEFVRSIFFWISVFTFPLFLAFVIDALSHAGPDETLGMTLRNAALGRTEGTEEIYGGLHILLWQVVYILELFFYSKKTRYRVFIMGAILLSYGALTMSKIVFLDLFVKTIAILYFKNKIKIRHILIGLGVLFFVFVAIQRLRYNVEMDAEGRTDFLLQYVVGNMSAFDTLKPASSAHWGENTFRFFYSVFYKTGLSDIKPVDAILQFIKEPIATNTYTVMYPFFKDFGYWGVGIFAMVLGLFYGWIFKKAQQGSSLFVLIYTILITTIIMQYAAEQFMTNFMTFFKQIVLVFIPFAASRYNFFVINRKALHES